jgi:hypothetical protein
MELLIQHGADVNALCASHDGKITVLCRLSRVLLRAASFTKNATFGGCWADVNCIIGDYRVFYNVVDRNLFTNNLFCIALSILTEKLPLPY